MPTQTMKSRFLFHALSILGILLLALICAPAVKAADVDFGVRGGVDADEEQPFVGGEVLFSMDSNQQWFGNPNVEHVFLDNGGLTMYSMDFHYDFPQGQSYTWWAGAGPTLLHQDTDIPNDSDSTDAGVNLLVGVGATQGKVRPYGQFKVVVADDTSAIAGLGIRF
ncbi:MAG TPA: hypothetical protein VFW45_06105 [Candidatus Polarisedimenticolia bacterium]|nr:hypothetical protein [Candidatus Polarisedimenticolia bacterium]